MSKERINADDLKRAYASAGYIIKGFQGTNCYGPVFATRGEANRWLHAEYEHVKPTRNNKHEKILRNYPEPLRIVRVEQ